MQSDSIKYKAGKQFVSLYLMASALLLFLHIQDDNHFDTEWQALPAIKKHQYNKEQIALIERQFNDVRDVLQQVADSHYAFPQYSDLVSRISLEAILPEQAADLHFSDVSNDRIKAHVNDILSTLDPYTKFQTEQDKTQYIAAKKGTYGIIVDDNTVLIKINAITPETPQNISAFLERSIESIGQHLTHIVLDLRGNTGGNLEAAYTIVDMFSNSGALGVFERRNPHALQYQQRTIKSFHSPVTDLPLSILVDGKTASSAELIAGALQQLVNATIIGQKTIGKASGQIQTQVNNATFSNEKLYITIGKIYLPDGSSYHNQGIVPDISVFDENSNASKIPVNLSANVLNNTNQEHNNLTHLTCKTHHGLINYGVNREIAIYDPFRQRGARAQIVDIGGRDLACALQAKAD